MLFDLGQFLATPGSLEALQESGEVPATFLRRHCQGDWGDALCPEDKALNDESVRDGSRILSAYTLKSGVKIWIITEADDEGKRLATTILLPEEY